LVARDNRPVRAAFARFLTGMRLTPGSAADVNGETIRGVQVGFVYKF
jgi:hypothetical protein